MPKNITYLQPVNHNLKIPTREEFHRYTSNSLQNSDFCTSYPSYSIKKTAYAIDWTIRNAKRGRNWKF